MSEHQQAHLKRLDEPTFQAEIEIVNIRHFLIWKTKRMSVDAICHRNLNFGWSGYSEARGR